MAFFSDKVAGSSFLSGENFTFSVDGTPLILPAGPPPLGSCSPVLAEPAGSVAITETVPAGTVLAGVSTLPGAKLLASSNLNAGTATVVVNAGGITIRHLYGQPPARRVPVCYAANPSAGESYVNLINSGANGAPLLGPGFGTPIGNICVNVYAFAPDEQEISCCSCLLTPNSLANLGVNRDLTSTTLTGLVPSSVVIKLVSTLAGGDGTGTSCTNSAATEGTLAAGMVAYGTTLQPAGGTYSAVEHTCTPSTLSAGEYASITGRCASILGNGSGFGVCNSCRSGALAAANQ